MVHGVYWKLVSEKTPRYLQIPARSISLPEIRLHLRRELGLMYLQTAGRNSFPRRGPDDLQIFHVVRSQDGKLEHVELKDGSCGSDAIEVRSGSALLVRRLPHLHLRTPPPDLLPRFQAQEIPSAMDGGVGGGRRDGSGGYYSRRMVCS